MFSKLRAACGHVITYLENRLSEGSTWVGIGGVFYANYMVTPPDKYIVIACGLVAMFLPTSGGKSE